jgi:hypothetical protein
MERSEGDMSLKNPVTPPGIDPGTVRLVAQRLNHYATPGPFKCTDRQTSSALRNPRPLSTYSAEVKEWVELYLYSSVRLRGLF